MLVRESDLNIVFETKIKMNKSIEIEDLIYNIQKTSRNNELCISSSSGFFFFSYDL